MGSQEEAPGNSRELRPFSTQHPRRHIESHYIDTATNLQGFSRSCPTSKGSDTLLSRNIGSIVRSISLTLCTIPNIVAHSFSPPSFPEIKNIHCCRQGWSALCSVIVLCTLWCNQTQQYCLHTETCPWQSAICSLCRWRIWWQPRTTIWAKWTKSTSRISLPKSFRQEPSIHICQWQAYSSRWLQLTRDFSASFFHVK